MNREVGIEMTGKESERNRVERKIKKDEHERDKKKIYSVQYMSGR